MKTERETTGIVRSWLEEGADRLPDRVLDSVLDQLPAHKQRRAPWWLPVRRFAHMNIYVKSAIAAAAVLVVAVVGFQFLPSKPGVVGDPSPTPVPTARPLADGALEPGTYRLDSPARTLVPFTFTIQDGWSASSEDIGGGLGKRPDVPGEMGFGSTIVTHVYGDACEGAGTPTPVGPTVDDLVRALVDQVNSDASTPIDLTVGGYPAKRVDMSIPPGLDTQTCDEPGVLIRIWADAAANEYFAIPATHQGTDAGSRVYIVDVEGQRVVIRVDYGPEASAADIAELDAMIASIRFEP